MPVLRRSVCFMMSGLWVTACGLLPGQTPAVPVAAPPAPYVHPVYPNGAGTPMGEAIAGLLAEPSAARAHWGIAVTAMDGTPIYGRSEGKLFRPASNAKLYTTAAAMALLGADATVTTFVSGNRPDAQGVVQGDLLLASDGDANISAMPFPYVPVAGETPPSAEPLKAINDLAAQVAAHGVKRITGGVVEDDTRWAWEPYPPSWAIDDMVWGYGAPVASVAVNDNVITLTVKAGARAGDAATVTQSPDVGYYTLAVKVKTGAAGSATRIEVGRAVGSRTVTVSGAIAPGGQETEQIAVSDPPLFAVMALRAALLARGIEVDGEAKAEEATAPMAGGFSRQSREPIAELPLRPEMYPDVFRNAVCTGECFVRLATRTSPPLAQDVMYTLKESQNLHAEMLLRRLGGAWGNGISGAQGVRVVRQFLRNAGLDAEDVVLYDGSGLGDHDLVTPRTTAQLLVWAMTQPWFAAWKAALPVGGVDGTLAGRFKDAPLKGHVFAKTGTLGESRALSGYVECASGRTVIFSVMADDHAPSGSTDRAVMDKIVAAIAANN